MVVNINLVTKVNNKVIIDGQRDTKVYGRMTTVNFENETRVIRKNEEGREYFKFNNSIYYIDELEFWGIEYIDEDAKKEDQQVEIKTSANAKSKEKYPVNTIKKYDLKNMVTIRPATKENGYNGYFEIPYTEYREDGTILCTGTEDFSSERLKEIKYFEIVEKTGEKTKESNLYKGGRNRWRHLAYIATTKRKNALKIAQFEHKNKKELQVR